MKRVINLFSLSLLMGCLFMGCQSPEAVESPVELPAAFSATGDAPMTSRWWESMEDDALNEAVDTALKENFSIREAWDNLGQVHAIAKREGAGLWPAVDLSAGADADHNKRNGLSVNSTSLLVGLAVSYEIDLWGRIRNAHRASEYDIDVSVQDLQSSAISVSGTLVEAWYNLAEARARLVILDEQIEVNEKLLSLLNTRFQQGQSQAVDVLRQEQLLESTRGLKQASERRAAILEHQILILMGKTPQSEFPFDIPALREPPALPETGVPSSLVARRPDLRAAMLEVLAEDRRLASAIGAQFPRISLSARFDKSGVNVSDLIDNWIASIAASLAQPIFDAGRLASDVERQRADRSAAINNYGALILNAFKEVEDALISEQTQRVFLESLEKQLAISEQVIERAETGYINGQLDYLDVLSAITNRQGLQRDIATARRDLILYRIELYRALAGGVSLDRPEAWVLTEDGKTVSEKEE